MIRVIFLFLLLSSCALENLETRKKLIKQIDNQKKFKEIIYKDKFDIFSLQRIDGNNSVVVYIEGDGLAWIDRFTPSSDPTPINPLGFKLASLSDSSSDVVYLARPCQYVKTEACNREIWTKLQYSKLILSTYENILKELSYQYSDIHLVGYSGGAVITMYLGSLKDSNIKSIRTIAGNIDPNEFTRLLNLTPFKTTVDLSDLYKNIKTVSQTHYYGINDKVIPQELHKNYQKKNLDNSCVKVSAIKASHNEGWEEFWKYNSKITLNC